MKISKLLVLSALCLFGFDANAQYNQREEPKSPESTFDKDALAAMDKTPQTFKADEYYVLYNKGAMKYFIAGNDWGTRASVGDNAAVVYFTQTSAAQAKGEGVYELKNYVKDKFQSAFAGAVDDFWTDNNSRADRFWKVQMNGTDFRFSNADTNPNYFAGWSQPKNDTRLYLLDANAAGAYVDWELYFAPGWKEYTAAKVVYDKSEELRKAIDLGTDADVDPNIIANAVTVYEELASTIDEMEAQIQKIMAAINAEIGKGATATNPVDVTELLVNTDYENNNNEGWSGDEPAFQTHGNAEFYEKNYTYYQTVKGARPGVYALKVRGYYRPGFTADAYAAFPIQNNRNAKLYAKTAGSEVHFPLVNQFAGATDSDLGLDNKAANINEEIYVPNTMEAAATYFDFAWNENAANYDNVMFFIKGEGDMALGLKKTSLISGDWTLFDNWTLEYYGNEADALQLVFENTKAAYVLPESHYVITTAYLNQFNTTAPASQSIADIVAALNTLEDVYDTLTTNAQLWLELDEVATSASAVGANENLNPDYTGPLSDWASSVFDLKGQRSLTNQELRTLIAQKKEEIIEAQKHVIVPNTDVTNLLTNPDYEQGATGWSGSPAMGSGGGNTCAEAYGKANFDIYQEVKGAPKGLYSIEVQGFFRLGRPKHENQSTNAWKIWEEGKQVAPAFVYLNDVQTALKCIYEEGVPVPEEGESSIYTQTNIDAPGDGNQYPNTMEQAAQAFAAEMYKSTAYGLVLNDGDQLRIGVKGSLDVASAGYEGANWAIWDNFKLVWVGYDAKYIQPVLEEQMAKYQALLQHNMGKTAYETLTARLAACEAAKTSGEGKDMFDALGSLLKIDSLLNASMAKFVELANAKVKLDDAIGQYESTASTEAIAAAQALTAEIANLLPAHSIEDAAADAYLVKAKEAIAALRVPVVDIDPTDENPFDMTVVIDNPSYDDNADGWSGTSAARNADYANAELFSKNYNYYQDLVGLPEGTYELNVQAFYRYGSAIMDYDSLGVQYTDHAFIYAASKVEGQDTVFYAKPLTRLATGAADFTFDLPADMEGYTYCATDSTEAEQSQVFDDEGEPVLDDKGNPTYTWENVQYKYVANTMAAASDEFYNEKYMDNQLIVKVPANGRLRIGLMKTTLIANDWTLFDNWTLKYFGKESSKQPDVNTEFVGVEKVASAPVALRTELFTIDGRRTSNLQKGIMIVKTTMSDGSIVVKKIRK